ncbi:MAG TPA: protein kinase, partial [Gemmatimonadales bacterium]|nr:protein kinase [Gemmatimonadales bacterium]
LVSRACPACQNTLPPEAQFCMHCGRATPTDPGVPPRMATTGAFEVAQVTQALAGRYRIERVLGEGGMATVYLAEDQKHRRKVAVKVMRPELAATLGSERFLREVQIAAQLSHPHILPMHDSGDAGGLLYYVMPYVEGETLKDRLGRDGALPPDEALRLAREIAEALAYAHRRGIVHRDIKPANILLGEGHALVADFGIARAVDEGGGEALTKTGLAIGTPQYMAPEQAAGEKDVDGRADVYATGAILYEMLTGEPPFTGANPRAILTKSLTEMPKPVSQVRTGVAPAVDAVVMKALAKQADDRYAGATEFMAAIDAVRTTSSGTMAAMTASQATQVVTPPAATAARVGGASRWLTPRNLAVAAVAAVGLFLALRGRSAGTGAGDAGGPRGNRLAVLPFHNEGAQSDGYLVDGVSDEVRVRLAGLGGLKVIAATSSYDYRDSRKAPQDAARELGADYVLTADARWSGEGAARQMQFVPKLLDVRSGKVLWEQRFDTGEDQIVGVPAAIALKTAEELGIALKPEEQAALGYRPTENAQAYRAFLRATQITGNDPETSREAIREYEQAVALDSQFAEAWARLSARCANLFVNRYRDPALAARSKEALDRAVALRPDAFITRRARFNYLSSIEGDLAAARAELDQLLRSAPNDAAVLASSAGFDLEQGDLGTALSKLERARELDPRSVGTMSNLATLYTFLDRGTDAVRTAEALVATAPQSVEPLHTLVVAHLSNGDLAGARAAIKAAVGRGIPATRVAAQLAGFQEIGFALEEPDQQLALRLTPSAFDNDRAWWGQTLSTLHWQRGEMALAKAYGDSALAPTRALVASSPDDMQLHSLLALVLAYTGRADEARAEIRRALPIPGDYSFRMYVLFNAAKVEMALGDKEAAVGYLEQVLKNGYSSTRKWLQIDPTFASLKGHPRFEQLLQGK